MAETNVHPFPKGQPGTQGGEGGLPGGGGGSTYDPMEARIIKLEAIAEDTRGSLESIQRQLARIDTKLDGKPDQGWIISMILAVFGLAFAAVAAASGIFALMK